MCLLSPSAFSSGGLKWVQGLTWGWVQGSLWSGPGPCFGTDGGPIWVLGFGQGRARQVSDIRMSPGSCLENGPRARLVPESYEGAVLDT